MSAFVRNFSTVLMGNSFAQIVSLLMYPLLTRLYGPSEMGTYSILLAAVIILGRLVDMTFSDAIVIPESDNEANGIVTLSIFTACCSTVVLSLVIALAQGSPWLLNKLEVAPSESWLLWFVPLGAFLTSFSMIQNHISIRLKRFGNFSLSKGAGTFFDRCGALGLGSFSYGTSGLIGGRIIGLLTSIFIQIQFFPKLSELRSHFKYKNLLLLCSKYRAFPMYGQWSVMVQEAVRQTPLIFMGFYFGAAQAGFLGLGIRTIQTPLVTIGDSVHKVYLQQAARTLENSLELSELSLSTVRYLAMVALPGIVALLFFGETLTAFIFGQQWSEAGVYVQILAVLFFLNFIMKPVGAIFILRKKQHINLIFHTLSLSAIALSLFVATLNDFSPRETIALYCFATSIVLFINFITACKLAKISAKNLYKLFLRNLVEISPITVAFYIMYQNVSSVLNLFILLCLILTGHYIAISLTDKHMRTFLLSVLHRKRG